MSLPVLDDARQRAAEEREEQARRSEGEAERLCRELRYAQQTVAGELAGWRDVHERLGRRAIRELARSTVVAEKMRLEGMLRALRLVREGNAAGVRLGVGASSGWERNLKSFVYVDDGGEGHSDQAGEGSTS